METALGFERLDLATLRAFLTALLIGALVGIEREKRKADGEGHLGGIRTFVLFAELGAIGGWLARVLDQPWLVVGVLAVAATPVLAGYVLAARVRPRDIGLTTEVAALVVCLLGAMTTLGHAEVAVGLAVVTALVLAYKQPLHGLIEKIGWDDVHAGLRLLVASFIVLPLLPDRAIDPLGAINPASLWLLVILISGLSLVGYVATRWLGQHRGAAVTGLTGGLVSSTAVTLAFARDSRERPAAAPALAGGIALAWCVMFVRVVVWVAVVNRDLLAAIAVPLAAMAVASAGMAWLALRRGRGEAPQGETVPLKNPFSLTSAIKFAALFALVQVAVKLVQAYAPGEGLYLVAAIAGLTDVDAITLSMAEYARSGDAGIAVGAIVIATVSNTLVKCAMAAVLGGRALALWVGATTAVVAVAGVVGVMVG